MVAGSNYRIMNQLKRFPIKYIRDFIKKDYKLRDECFICGSKEKLELHHLLSISELFNKWCFKNKINAIDDVDYIKKYHCGGGDARARATRRTEFRWRNLNSRSKKSLELGPSPSCSE